MTTASTRAVSLSSVSRLRIALLAAASASLMATMASPAGAAACATTAGNDSCVITLGDLAVSVDGQTGTDTLQFDPTVLSVNASQFGTVGPANFLNFETAEVLAGTSLVLTMDNTANLPGISKWIVDGTGTLAITGSASNPYAFAGTIEGAGNITKAGANKVTLGGSNLLYTGATSVTGGTLEIANGNAIINSTSISINSAELTGTTAYTINAPVTIISALNTGRLTGNATINGNVSSNGGLQAGNTAVPPGGTIENPGQLMGTITIGQPYTYTATGANAYVGSFIDIDNAAVLGGTPGVTHDFLDIQGNIGVSQYRTMFALAPYVAATGTPTTGNGIQVIRVGGSNSGNDFYQGSAMNAGAYQYLLKYVQDYSGVPNSADGYFLQSAVRDELVARPAIISAGQALVRDCYHDNQRVPDSPKGATYGRGWIGYGRGSSTFGSDTGVKSDVNFSCTTGGLDWRMGGGWFGGVSGGFGDTDGTITTAAGEGKFTGSGRSAEVFASFTSRALFINLSAGYNAMDYIYNGAFMSNLKGKTAGLLATAQTGVALDLDAVAVKLMGQLSYDGTNCSDTCFGVRATQDSGLVEAKGSVRFDGVANDGSIRPWVAVSISDVLSNGINTAAINGVEVSQDANSQLVSLDGGMQAYLDQNFALTLEGGYHESLSVDVSGYKAAVGLKMYW